MTTISVFFLPLLSFFFPFTPHSIFLIPPTIFFLFDFLNNRDHRSETKNPIKIEESHEEDKKKK